MYVDKLSKAQLEEYLRVVVLGKDFDDKEISGISCDLIDEEDSLNPMYNLSYLMGERYDDENETKPYEQEVLDFDTNADHLHFMISKFGINYALAVKSYAKTPEGKEIFGKSDLKQCDRILEKTMCEEKLVVGLENFVRDSVEADGVSCGSEMEMERQ